MPTKNPPGGFCCHRSNTCLEAIVVTVQDLKQQSDVMKNLKSTGSPEDKDKKMSKSLKQMF